MARVRARAEFDRVFADGRRTSDPLFALHWLRDGAPARLGLAVSRHSWEKTAPGSSRREKVPTRAPEVKPGL